MSILLFDESLTLTLTPEIHSHTRDSNHADYFMYIYTSVLCQGDDTIVISIPLKVIKKVMCLFDTPTMEHLNQCLTLMWAPQVGDRVCRHHINFVAGGSHLVSNNSRKLQHITLQPSWPPMTHGQWFIRKHILFMTHLSGLTPSIKNGTGKKRNQW